MHAAVVAVTCRHDAMELMEKRARSRFSHRKLVVAPPSSARPDRQARPAPLLQYQLCSRACCCTRAAQHGKLRRGAA